MLRTLATVAVGFALLTGAAVAETAWTAATLGDGTTIDKPADAVDQQPPSERHLAMFNLRHEGGNLLCSLLRENYDASMSRQGLERDLADKTPRERFCEPLLKDDDATDFQMISSDSATTADGHLAGTCVARQTSTRKKVYPGEVHSVQFVLASKHLYIFYCIIGAASTDAAQAAFDGGDADMIAHMQHSLRLPADENENAQ